MSRIAFLAIVALSLTILAGLDLRFAFASRDLSSQTAALLDQHERRANAIGAVTPDLLDQHERRVAAAARLAEASSATFASGDQHERRAARSATITVAELDQHERPGRGLATSSR